MPKLSKAAHLSFIENNMGEVDLADVTGQLEDLANTAAIAVLAAETAAECAAEAMGHHEERKWEDWDEQIENLGAELQELSDALDDLERLDMELLVTLKLAVETARKQCDDARIHHDALI